MRMYQRFAERHGWKTEVLGAAEGSVGGVKEITDYFKLFDYDINLLVDAIKKSGAK